MKVLVTDKINEIAKEIMQSPEIEVDILPTMPEDELCTKILDYDALMIRSQTKVTDKILNSAKNLKIVGRAGVGVDNVDLESATKHGIIVVNSPDGNTNAAAEHTLALMLAMSRNIPTACASTKDGKWERSKFTGVEVFGKTLGVIGLGKIGSHVAKVALTLGMKVVVYDPYTTKEIVNAMSAEYISDLNDFWKECDYITIHVPKTKETAHLINAGSISKMKDGVRIINCARGGIIDEVALAQAITNGKVASAAIDVFETEPNITESPLYGIDKNILLTPHLGASTSEAQLNVAIDVANQIKDVLSGGSATSAVNIPSLKPAKLEPVKDYMQLAENIGELAQQLTEGQFTHIEISFRGNLASLDTSPLETAILKGIFSSFMQNVNYVNAPLLAKQRGINVITSKSETSGDYIGSITVKMNSTIISGALIAKNVKRIVKINDYTTSIEPAQHMLLVPHENKPAMIAKVATVIGEYDTNINHMLVSPSSEKNNVSIMIINTGDAVNSEALNKIREIDGITQAKYVHLNA